MRPGRQVEGSPRLYTLHISRSRHQNRIWEVCGGDGITSSSQGNCSRIYCTQSRTYPSFHGLAEKSTDAGVGSLWPFRVRCIAPQIHMIPSCCGKNSHHTTQREIWLGKQ